MQTALDHGANALSAATTHDDSFYRATLDGVSVPVAVCALGPVAGSDDPVVYANATFRAWFEGAADPIGLPISQLFGAQTNRRGLQREHDALVRGEAVSRHTTLYPLAGPPLRGEIRRTPLPRDAAPVTHYVFSFFTPGGHDMVAAGGDSITELTTLARELFTEFEPVLLVRALTRGVKTLTGASNAQLFAETADGARLVPVSDLGPGPEAAPDADEFVTSALTAKGCILDLAGKRAALALRQSGERRRVLLVSLRDDRRFTAEDVFAISFLAQNFSVAARNVELFNELETRRAEVLELSSIKSDLIAMLAHDFAGPLTSIGGHAELLLDTPDIVGQVRDSLLSIQRSAARLSGLARDTLTLSRLERNEFELTLEPVDIAQLVADVASAVPQHREVRLHCSTERMVVRADRGRLRQVFENVIGNAIKYSPGGEPVDIAVRRRSGKIRVTVRDRGIGIPSSDRHAIFTRFLRASNARRMGIAGSGFGLYLSRIFVERLGGRITFASRAGRGTSFSVELPLGYARTEPPRTRRILLVDRDGDARSFTAHSLRLVNYSVRTVDVLEDALRTLGREPFDVAIFDCDSVALALSPADLKEIAVQEVKLISLGGDLRAQEAGWDVHLTKPFMARDLQRAVEAALGVGPSAAPGANG
jgi:signal transduction histidine kinase/CheY-like chemotaxis protein